jgi:hypothetical protein
MHLGNNDLLAVRDLTMILLSFARFLRFDEVSSLLCSDVKIECEYLFLFIRKSKTDLLVGSFLLHIPCTHLILYIMEFIVLCVAPESSKCVIKRAICTG